MKCPSCKRQSRKLLIIFDKKGEKSEGCEACLRPSGTAHLYTGRKLWTGDEVYGREKCLEKDHAFEQRLIARQLGGD